PTHRIRCAAHTLHKDSSPRRLRARVFVLNLLIDGAQVRRGLRSFDTGVQSSEHHYTWPRAVPHLDFGIRVLTSPDAKWHPNIRSDWCVNSREFWRRNSNYGVPPRFRPHVLSQYVA